MACGAAGAAGIGEAAAGAAGIGEAAAVGTTKVGTAEGASIAGDEEGAAGRIGGRRCHCQSIADSGIGRRSAIKARSSWADGSP